VNARYRPCCWSRSCIPHRREDPARILAVFGDALPAGSYLTLSHATADFRPAAAQVAAAMYDQATSPVTLRTRA